MASFLSAISLVVLVLATGCFTLPLDTKYPATTPLPPLELEITTGSLIIDRKDRVNMQLVSKAESTSVPNFDHPHKFPYDQSNLEWTTAVFEAVTRSPRGDDAEDDQSKNELEERGVDHLSVSLLPETYTTGSPFTSSHLQQDRKIFDSTVSSTTPLTKLQPRQENDEEESKLDERSIKDEEEEDDEKDERGLKDDEEEDEKDERDLKDKEEKNRKDERTLDDEEESKLDERGLKDEEEEDQKGERRLKDDEEKDEKDERDLKDKEENRKDERSLKDDEEEDEKDERDLKDKEEKNRKDQRGLKDYDEEEDEKDERGLKDDEEEDQQDERALEDEEESPKDERELKKDDEKSTLEERAANDELEMTTGSLTSSTVAPYLYTSDPSSSSVVSFGQYTGLLTDDQHVPKKPTKIQPSDKWRTKVPLTIMTTEATKEHVDDESEAPIAQLDQDASVKVPNVKSHAMVLENDTFETSKLPQQITTSTLANEYLPVQQAPLAQGEQPVQFEETQSDN